MKFQYSNLNVQLDFNFKHFIKKTLCCILKGPDKSRVWQGINISIQYSLGIFIPYEGGRCGGTFYSESFTWTAYTYSVIFPWVTGRLWINRPFIYFQSRPHLNFCPPPPFFPRIQLLTFFLYRMWWNSLRPSLCDW